MGNSAFDPNKALIDDETRQLPAKINDKKLYLNDKTVPITITFLFHKHLPTIKIIPNALVVIITLYAEPKCPLERYKTQGDDILFTKSFAPQHQKKKKKKYKLKKKCFSKILKK